MPLSTHQAESKTSLTTTFNRAELGVGLGCKLVSSFVTLTTVKQFAAVGTHHWGDLHNDLCGRMWSTGNLPVSPLGILALSARLTTVISD